MDHQENIQYDDDDGQVEATYEQKAELEEHFVSALDAVDDFLRLNDRLQEHLKQAFLHLARAKYSMGVHRVSSANFDAHLEASTLISVSKDPPSFSLLPPGKGVLKRSMHEPEQATGEACEEARCPEDSAGTEQAPQPASKQPFDSHSLIADLKRRFVLEEDGNGSESFLDEGHSMRTPLCMLGGMVSPHLRKAQDGFMAVIADAVALANARTTAQASAQSFVERKRALEASLPAKAQTQQKALT